MIEFSNNSECSIQVTCVEHLDKGRYKVYLDSEESFILYRSEIRSYDIHEGDSLKECIYQQILKDVIGKRAKKRALFLLERMDRTESQLREKLALSEYPKSCIEDAIAYVNQFHYVDDLRYARNFVRCSKDRLSRQQLKQKLMAKGVDRDYIDKALEEEYSCDETTQIHKILEKKQYMGQEKNTAEFRKMYQYLLRRGFRSCDILREMGAFQTES